MQKVKSPPVNLDKYLEAGKKRYLNYEDAARCYSMPYWTLVNLAKTICRRETAYGYLFAVGLGNLLQEKTSSDYRYPIITIGFHSQRSFDINLFS